tara:strand:+ start:101 stop:601 length:501 start_codon:yes stop_codon:yes gene_type:complete
MIDTKKAFIRLLKDLEESSPKFSSTLKEISPIKFCIHIRGHKKIYVTIDGAESKISFNENDFNFEIQGSLLELLEVLSSKKIKRSLISGDIEIAIILFNAIIKSNIDLIYLIDKYFGNLPALIAYTIANKLLRTPKVHNDSEYKNLQKRLRDISIRLDRIEAIKTI